MNFSKFLSLILCLSVFLSTQLSNAFVLKKSHASYATGLLLLCIGIKKHLSDDGELASGTGEAKVYDERGNSALFIALGITSSLNTLMRSGNFSKKDIVDYIISGLFSGYGIYLRANMSPLKALTREAASDGTFNGTVLGSGLGILGSNVVFDVVSKLK
jgi:hypothetical protein